MWTEDDAAIYCWAKGHIFKLNTSSGAVDDVPFSVDVQLQLADTVRSPQDASTGQEFRTKVVTSFSYANDNSLYVFNSVGDTYVQQPFGAPAPIASGGSNRFTFGAKLSPLGDSIVHTTWNDVAYGTVEVCPKASTSSFDCGNSVTLTTQPGRYADPSFSNDGSKVVFTKLGTDTLSGPFEGTSTGLYMANADGTSEEPTLLRTGNVRAHFTAGDLELLIESGNSVTLRNLGSGEETVLTTGTSYYQYVTMSPNLECIAFVEERKAYLVCDTTFDGSTITSRPDAAPENLWLLSREGSIQMTFSSDSQRLRWVHGSVVYTVRVSAVQACARGQTSEVLACVSEATTSQDLSVTVTSGVARDILVLDNALLVTMATGNMEEDIIPNGRLVIEGETILAVGPMSEVAIPAGALVKDMEGGVVMPGFIDGHAHFSLTSKYKVQQSWQMLLNLAYGVTTLHNPSIDTLDHFEDAELVKAGKKLGPRLFATGTILYGADGGFRTEINDMDDARAALQRLKDYGAFSTKSYNQPSRAARQRILTAARELNMLVVPEGGMVFHWNTNQIIDGHTTIEHNLPVELLYDDLVQLWVASGTMTIPTHGVSYGDLNGEQEWYQKTDVFALDKMKAFHPERDLQAASIRRTAAPDSEYSHRDASRTVAKIIKVLHCNVTRLVLAFACQYIYITYTYPITSCCYYPITT